MTTDLMAEAEKMRRVPGITFADGPTGRRARIAGTGIEVFEVIFSYRSMGESWDRLRTAFHWLSDDQLLAALTYAQTYPEEINARIKTMESFRIEDVWEKRPATKPAQ